MTNPTPREQAIRHAESWLAQQKADHNDELLDAGDCRFCGSPNGEGHQPSAPCAIVLALLDQLRAEGQPPQDDVVLAAHAALDAGGIASADGVPCYDSDCQSKLVHRIKSAMSELATLRQQLAQAQDEAQENWQSVKKRKARAEAMLQALKKINALPSELAGDAWAIARAALAEEKAKR